MLQKMLVTLIVLLGLLVIVDAGSPVTVGASCNAQGGAFSCINGDKMYSCLKYKAQDRLQEWECNPTCFLFGRACCCYKTCSKWHANNGVEKSDSCQDTSGRKLCKEGSTWTDQCSPITDGIHKWFRNCWEGHSYQTASLSCGK